jgi:enoyl-CoA hydratase/carnithine racemase
MFAMGHDYRLQRKDRGYMCAIEVEIGVGIPPPEMELFRHAMPPNAFFETTMGAKRWGAKDSLARGLIHGVSSAATLFDDALKFAENEARLARGPNGRKLYRSVKNAAKGEIDRGVMQWCFPGGELPALLSANKEAASTFKDSHPYLLKSAVAASQPAPAFEMLMPAKVAKL